MIESALATIGKLFEELTWRRFLAIIVFAALALSSVLLYERYTSNFRLSRVQRTAEALKTLREIERLGLESGSDTAELHAALVTELQTTLNAEPLSIRLPSFYQATLKHANVYKFLAGGFWWFLFAVFTFRSALRGDKDAGSAAIAFIVLGVFFGGIGWLLPTYRWPWFNLVLYPVVHIVLLIVLMIAIALRYAPSQKELHNNAL